jgi:hypothetical protein
MPLSRTCQRLSTCSMVRGVSEQVELPAKFSSRPRPFEKAARFNRCSSIAERGR